MAEQLECDIIMRGGITSGVVYPGVLHRLSSRYRFRNIGGASAGAIAAGVAAAAQYGVNSGRNPQAFEVVRAISEEISGAAKAQGRHGTDFRTIFRPAAGLEPVMGLALEWLGLKGAQSPVIALLKARLARPVLAGAGIAFLAGVLLIAALGEVAGWANSAGGWPLLLLFAVLFGLLAAIPGAAVALLLKGVALRRRGFPTSFAANGFGICAGVNPEIQQSGTTEDFVAKGGFADWMHATIQRAAGLGMRDVPLLVHQLWGQEDAWSRDRDIDLVFTTTNLSQQLPHQFPFLERADSRLYFTREDMERVLPKPVVDYMVGLYDQTGPDVTGGRRDAYRESPVLEQGGRFFYRLPMPQHLPILLGIRMSMSFPVLISAMKFYEASSRRARAGEELHLVPCWFSDGGITSNFPVTSFDSPLPTRPTFCINLDDLHPRAAPDAPRVRMPARNSDDIRPRHKADIDGGGPFAFFTAIVDTARNGYENELVTMPGQRDRIVTVLLDPASEGGLNLDMPPETVVRMSGYGALAADKLIARYDPHTPATAPDTELDWANHRWIRLRGTLAGLEGLLRRVSGSWGRPQPDGSTYADVIATALDDAPSYPWISDTILRKAGEHSRQLRVMADAITAEAPQWPGETLFNGRRKYPADPASWSRDRGAPQPTMSFQLRPVGGRDPLKG